MQTLGTMILIGAMTAGGYMAWPAFETSFAKNGWIPDGTEDVAKAGDPVGGAPDLTTDSSTQSPGDGSGEPVEPVAPVEPVTPPEPEVPAILASLEAADFPSKIRIKSSIELLDRNDASAPPVPMLSESLVVPVRLEGAMLEVTPSIGSPLRAKLPYDQTDLLERVEAAEKSQQASNPDNTGGGASNENGNGQEPAKKLDLIGEEAAVAMVKKDILSERLSELRADQVKKFSYQGMQTVKDQDAEVVLVEFETDTLFGRKRVQARAAIKDGKVYRWEWASTGFEMR